MLPAVYKWVSTLQEDSFRFLRITSQKNLETGITRFNPPRGFISISTRFQHGTFVPNGEIVSTLQEDSFRFLPLFFMSLRQLSNSFNPPRGFISISTRPF